MDSDSAKWHLSSMIVLLSWLLSLTLAISIEESCGVLEAFGTIDSNAAELLQWDFDSPVWCCTAQGISCTNTTATTNSTWLAVTALNISNAAIEGFLPASLAKLPLEALDVSGNNLVGTIKPVCASQHLLNVSLADNAFTGQIQCFNVTSLV